MSAPKKIDSFIYNELVSGACEDAKETFSEEGLGYWYSGDPRGGEFPPKAERCWADGWVKTCGERDRANDAEWDLYKRTYEDAMRFVVKYVEVHWDPECEDDDGDLHDDVCVGVESQLADADFKVGKPDPAKALLRACRLVLAIEAYPEQNPTETVSLSPKTREQIRAAVRAAE